MTGLCVLCTKLLDYLLGRKVRVNLRDWGRGLGVTLKKCYLLAILENGRFRDSATPGERPP